MTNIKERIAFLQGLAQGLEVDENSKEGRLLNGIIDVLGEMAEQLDDMEVAQTDLEEYVESIDEDLFDLEGEIFGEEDFDEEDMLEVECPNCRETVCFESEIVDDEDLIEVTCPNCDEVVYVNDQDIPSLISDEGDISNKKDDDL